MSGPSPVSPFPVSVTADIPCTAHAFFHERLYNHCQRLRLTFPEICTKSDLVPLSDQLRNRIRPVTRLQIKGCKKSARPPRCEILYTNSLDMLALSSTVASDYYNFYTGGSTNPENYGHPSITVTLPPSMSRFSRQCGILDISQPYRPLRPVKGIALLFYPVLQ
jgi:hypothetical protein